MKSDGSPGAIEAFPWTGTQIIDTDFGPDGALYVLDYGTGGGDQALYRIEYIGGTNRNPIARAAANKTSGPTPLAVTFSSAGSSDPEGGALTYAWNFGDGGTSTAAGPSHTYTANGTYTPTLTVRDPQGLTATASLVITVGNTAPSVTLNQPANGRLFSFGDTVPFDLTVTDPEDGAVDCARVKVTYLLGHDSHQHSITSKTGCTGSIAVPVDGEHDSAANIFGVFDAEYTDNGGLTTHSSRSLQPRHRQAEHFGAQSGVQTADHAGAEGGRTVGFTDNGDWISFTQYVLGNATRITARVSSGGPGGTVEVRSGSATGTLLGTMTVANTGGWDTFADVSANLTNAPGGTTALFLVFKGVTGQGNLLDLDAFTFTTGATGTSQTVEGESFTSTSGVQPAAHAPASGGQTAGYIENADWAGYSQVSTAGAKTFTAKISSGGPGGTITVRSGSQTGTVLGTVGVPGTGGWENFQTVSTTLTGTASGPLFLVFSGGSGSLFDVDTITVQAGTTTPPPAVYSNVHVFYYPWYGGAATGYRHWQQGGHTPPGDIGADLYPKLGAYDSGDVTAVVNQHMSWLRQAGAGVLVYSWWGRGSYEDGIARRVLDAAQQQGIKVAWHIEPYTGRTAASVVADVRYLNQTYGAHPAYYRYDDRPAFYIFSSLSIADWTALDQVNGDNTILAQTTDTSRVAHFSGLYTYDAIAGATAPGWAGAAAYAKSHNLIWAPSVGPGYVDDRAVPGNTTPTLGRDNGATYDKEWTNALATTPTWVSITSFNEWHEGSVIEPAVVRSGYQSFEGAYGRTGAAAETSYLDRTKYWGGRLNP